MAGNPSPDLDEPNVCSPPDPEDLTKLVSVGHRLPVSRSLACRAALSTAIACAAVTSAADCVSASPPGSVDRPAGASKLVRELHEVSRSQYQHDDCITPDEATITSESSVKPLTRELITASLRKSQALLALVGSVESYNARLDEERLAASAVEDSALAFELARTAPIALFFAEALLKNGDYRAAAKMALTAWDLGRQKATRGPRQRASAADRRSSKARKRDAREMFDRANREGRLKLEWRIMAVAKKQQQQRGPLNDATIRFQGISLQVDKESPLSVAELPFACRHDRRVQVEVELHGYGHASHTLARGRPEAEKLRLFVHPGNGSNPQGAGQDGSSGRTPGSQPSEVEVTLDAGGQSSIYLEVLGPDCAKALSDTNKFESCKGADRVDKPGRFDRGGTPPRQRARWRHGAAPAGRYKVYVNAHGLGQSAALTSPVVTVTMRREAIGKVCALEKIVSRSNRPSTAPVFSFDYPPDDASCAH